MPILRYFLDENLQPITNLMGKFSAKLEPYLNMIANNQYKSIKPRAMGKLSEKFKSKIKE
jgi:hypothetical protein